MVFRILGTIFMGLSFISMAIKNASVASSTEDNPTSVTTFIGLSTWGILWRTFIIVALWLI